MRRVAFLPEEFGGAQKETGAQLPAHDVAPLVQQERQIAIALDPLREHRVDDRLGRRPHDQRFLERRRGIDRDGARPRLSRGAEPRVGDDRHLFRKPLDVLRFLGEKTHRNEQREVGVAVAGGLEHGIQGALHQLPNAVAVGPDDHAATHRRIIRELRLHNDVAVPLAKVLGAWRDALRFSVLRLCHQSKYPLRSWRSGTRASVPARRSRTTALPSARSSGPTMTARAAPRAEASSSCLRTPACRRPYSTEMPRSRKAWASCNIVGRSSPPTAIKKAPSSVDALGAAPRSLRSSPRTTSPMPNPRAGRSRRPAERPPPAIARK